MGGMAGDAAFSLDGGMFPGKGTSLVRVAVEADLVLRGGGTQLVLHKAAVLVVAVAAGNQSFIHAMVKRLGEIRLNFKMAAVTKVGLGHFQKLPVHFGRVHGVTIHAANIIFQVLRTQEVGVLFTKLMAGEATLGRFLAREGGKTDDLGGIGRFGMFLAGTVAGFATLELHAFVFVQLGLPVRATVITFGLLLVAGLAGFSPYILRGIDALMALDDLFIFFLVAAGLAALRVGVGSFVVPMLLGTGNGKPNHTYKKNQ